MNNKIMRDLNFELLKIISIVMIMILHYLQSGIINNL